MLRNIMEFLVGAQTPTSTETWARYFLMKILESPKTYWFLYRTNFPLAGMSCYTFYIDVFRKFLFCYFQPACWKAASQVYREFQNNSYIALQYPLEECFVIASTATSKPEKILRRFNFQSQFTLQDYTFNSIKRMIRNQVSRELKLENIKFSDYGLLRRIHEGELRNYLLQYSGSSLDKPLELYCLAWQAFNECADEWLAASSSHSNGHRNAVLKYLSGDRLQVIADRYNQYLQRRSQPTNDRVWVGSVASIDASEMQQMLETCARATRHCQNARSFPLDPQEDFSDPNQTPFDILASTEEQERLQGIKKVIWQRFQQLDSRTQTCLQLWLGLGFNQSDFLTFLNLKKQYQVARHFQRFQKELLKAVFEYLSQQQPDGFSPSLGGEVDYVLKECLMYIKEFLTQTCTDYFGDLLVDIVTKRMSIAQRRDLLASLSEANPPPQFLDNLPSATDSPSGMQPSSPEGEDLEDNSAKQPSPALVRVQQELYAAFWEEVETNLQVDLGQFPSSPKSVATFIEKWLRDNHAVLYQT
ncbi:hypothetical protein [Geitlerinema sp. PCC 9228]|uniref:hypothetical protein n=1 Tax=Geitlerinema sp. PCC 9228 TaxID=111611 RepID=UPI001114834B|nr:hypothetical protein [Geitlerinema sp. PCC 9228]